MKLLKNKNQILGCIAKNNFSMQAIVFCTMLGITLISNGCKHDPEDCANNPQLCLATCINDPTYCVDVDAQAKSTEETEKATDSTAAVAKLPVRVEIDE
jgi:hypothetical protein